MTNDLTTLNGSLIECKDRLEANLQSMGISDAEYDSATGLLGLIDQILNIETSSGDVEISTSITSTITIASGQNYYIDDTFTVTGTLTASTLDNITLNGIQGATVYMYNIGTNGDLNDLMGSGTTNAAGEFSITGVFHKANDYINIKLLFNGTTHFLSSYKTQNSSEQVQKKPVSLPQNLTNKWMLEPRTYTASIGSQYSGVTVSLFLDDSSYQTANVDNSGDVTFDISDLYGSEYIAQLKIVNDPQYADAQSNTFTLNFGVNIYVNPEFEITSTKNILSYVDNDSATMTIQLQDENMVDLSIPDIPIYITDGTQDFSAEKMLSSFNNDEIDCIIPDADESIIEFQAKGQLGISVASEIGGTDSEITQVSYDNYHSFKIIDDGSSLKIYRNDSLDQTVSPYINIRELYIYGDGYIKSFTLKNISYTDSNGSAEYIYPSRGIGDVQITATYGSLVSETYDISDRIKYDKGDVDNTSKYTASSNFGSFTHNNDGYYTVVTKQGYTETYPIEINNVSNLNVPCEITYKVMLDGFNPQSAMRIIHSSDTTFTINYYDHKIMLTGAPNITYNSSLNTWYGVKLTIESDKITAKLYDSSDNLLYTLIKTDLSISSFTPKFYLGYHYDNGNKSATMKFKELSIKPLDFLSLSANKSVLSYADSDSCTLTATHSHGTGHSVSLYDSSDDSLIGSMTDEGDGTYSYTYNSQGIGDVGFYAKSGNIVSDSYTIEDCTWYRSGASVDGLHIDSGVSCTSDGTWISITTSSSGEKYVVTPIAIGQNDDFEYSFIMDWTNTVNQITWGLYSSYSSPTESNRYMSFNKTNNNLSCYMDSTTVYNTTWATGDKITIKKKGTSFKVYHNGNEIISTTYTQSGTKYIGFYTNSGRVQVFKELILKPLHSVTLTADNSILSYADSTPENPSTSTLTATHSMGTGQTVKLYNASTDTLVGTMTDEGDGTYSYTYASQGIGNVGFYAKSGALESEPCTVHDYYYYDTETVDKNKYEVQSGRSATLSYSSNGLTVVGGSSSDTWVTNTSFSLPTNYEAEVTITAWSGSYYGRLAFENLQVEPNASNILIILSGNIVQTWSHTLQANDVIKVVKNGTSMNVYCNNSLIGTYTVTANGIYRRWTYNGRSLTTKNLTVKQLSSN